MAPPSARIVRRVVADFGDDAELVLWELESVPEAFSTGQVPDAGVERLHASLVVGADTDLARFDELVAIGRVDFRDLLVWTGFGSEDWPARLDRELGPR